MSRARTLFFPLRGFCVASSPPWISTCPQHTGAAQADHLPLTCPPLPLSPVQLPASPVHPSNVMPPFQTSVMNL